MPRAIRDWSGEGLAYTTMPMQGRAVVVTRVGRRAGIAHATPCRLAAQVARLCCHDYSSHDVDQPWGGADIDAVLAGVHSHLVATAQLTVLQTDLADPTGPARLIDGAIEAFGHVDGLVVSQALSGSNGQVDTG